MNQVEVDALEQDTLIVLGLVRSMKNNFVPVSRIPGAILSLIPKYLERQSMGTSKDLITLTHVCREWRELFMSYPSLWTRLNFDHVEKTRAYIERSGTMPLELTVCKGSDKSYSEAAFLLAVPHVKRFKSITVGRTPDFFRNLTDHLPSSAPFLKDLQIDFVCDPAPVLDDTLFNGGLSSLRTLKLGGVVTNLPWRNLWNLTTFELWCPPGNKVTITKLLGFLEGAPCLEDITLHHSIPSSSDASSSRVVHLPRLKKFAIVADPVHAILLNHLTIPTEATLTLEFDIYDDYSPLPDCLPKSAKNLKNIFRIITVSLLFTETKKFMRLVGPNGGLYIYGRRDPRVSWIASLDSDRRILHSLDYFPLHMTQRLAITKLCIPTLLAELDKSPPLVHMKALRALVLIRCYNLPFILALNPKLNLSKDILCPNLEELVLYVEARDKFYIMDLVGMAKERALRGVKLRLITVVGLDELVSGKEVFRLREYVSHVEYRIEENPPKWDSILDEGN